MLPNFLIIGAQKSGSTFIHKCLAEHPDVFMPTDEIPFFEDPEYNRTDLSKLEELFDGGDTRRALGIKRPNILYNEQYLERIHRHIPNAKLIVVLRNPVERAVTAYFHYVKDNFIPVMPFEKGFMNILDGNYLDRYLRSSEILDFGFYYKGLMQCLKYFDRENILVLFFDDLKTDSLGLMKRVYGFLDVDDNYVPKSLNLKPQAGTYSLIGLKLANFRTKFIYRYNSDRTRFFLKDQSIFDKFCTLAIEVILRFLFASGLSRNKKPKISLELRKRLLKVYEEDIVNLEALMSRDLSGWRV